MGDVRTESRATTQALPDTAATTTMIPFLIMVSVGAAMSLALGAYGNVHAPTGKGIATFGFPAVLPMKAWFATGAAVLGLGQLTSALWMWGKLPFGKAPGWIGPTHRWLGTAAFLLTLPVAYHCLWALGFRTANQRVLLHSLLGCAFYGVFTTKMLVLRSRRLAGWMLPAVGGLLVTILTGLWLTSSLWFFTNIGFPGV